MKNGNEKSILKYIFIVLIAIVAVLMGMAVYVFYHAFQIKDVSAISSEKQYDYHFAMIYSGDNDEFWSSMYEGAREKGEELGVYVEDFGNTVQGDYSEEDLVEMAIAAQVDGIIVEGTRSETLSSLIDQADEAGIAVVTMYHDVADSKRKAYVGINAYAIGELYGNQVAEVLQKKQEKNDGEQEAPFKVTILLDALGQESGAALVTSSIRDTVSKSTSNIEISDVTIENNEDFESEEIIRNLVLNKETRPDLVICTGSVDTINCSQIVTDYNLVGNITILGYYSAPEILDGISKGIIKSSVAVDAKAMGATSVEYLDNFITNGYVSEYATVEMNLITQDNVQEYSKQAEDEGE